MFKWLGKIFSSGGDALVLTNEVKPKRARSKGRFKADDKLITKVISSLTFE